MFSTMRQCLEAVLHHVQEEESEIFPLLRSCRDEARLMDLGARMAQAYEMAPTRDSIKDAGDRG